MPSPLFENTSSSTCNVKGHFYVQTPITLPEHIEPHIVRRNNFWTFRRPSDFSFVYVIFPRRGYVNVSGIKAFDECERALTTFEQLFHALATSGFCVDNSTASGCFTLHDSHQRLHLPDLLRVRDTHPCTISIRPDYFPAALVRPTAAAATAPALEQHSISTCILFANGKFIIVGSKSPEQTTRTVLNLESLVNAAQALSIRPPEEEHGW